MKLLFSPFILTLVVVLSGLGGIYLLFGPGPAGNQAMDMNGDMNTMGPIQSHRSYNMEILSGTTNVQPSKSTEIQYIIKDDQGTILKGFDVVHEKIMHFIIVRKDLQQFQHIHPDFDSATGEFKIPVNFATDGPYRLFADFTPSSSQIGAGGERLPVTLHQDINVGNGVNYKPQPVAVGKDTGTFDGYNIRMVKNAEEFTAGKTYTIGFEIKRSGVLIKNLQQYLGALGHTVVLKEGDLQFIHAHPTQESDATQTGIVNFDIHFMEPGSYKLFSQFQYNGNIITSDFGVEVLESDADSEPAPEHLNH